MTKLGFTLRPLNRLYAFLGLTSILSLLALPLLLNRGATAYTWDEINYHLPAVRQIQAHWPALEVARDSLSATAPGYHWMLAGVSLFTGAGQRPMRLVTLGVSLGIIALLCLYGSQSSGQSLVFFAVLPLAASNFLVKSAACVVTDNPALLGVTASLLILFGNRPPRFAHWAGCCIAATVCIRQSAAWLLGPLLSRLACSRPRHLVGLLAVVPTLVVLGWLLAHWGGLVPPAWQANHRPDWRATMPAAAAYQLAVIAMLGPFYYLAAGRLAIKPDWYHPATAIGALLGLGAALAGPNRPDYVAGRWGGYLWDLAASLPAIGNFSLLFICLAPVGGALLAVLFRKLHHSVADGTAWTWLVAVLSWGASGLANRQVFHRYYEPTILVFLICWLLLQLDGKPAPPNKLRLLPLGLLGLAQLAVTLVTAHGRTFGWL